MSKNTKKSNNKKSRFKNIQENPVQFVKESSIKELETFIKNANNAYYNTGKPLISDEAYDIIIDEFKIKSPNNKVLNMIGAPLRSQVVKVKLPFWMGSMNKVKPKSRDLELWLQKYQKPYLISQKLDGLSGMVTYNIGQPNQVNLYTRGDGNYGQDISHLIPFLKLNDPILIQRMKGNEIGLRGEFIMKKAIFQNKYAAKYPKARSLISGVINAKEPNIEVLKDMDFVIYEIIYNTDLKNDLKKEPIPVKVEDQFNAIKKLGFNCVDYIVYNQNLNSDILIKLLLDMKTKSLYEIDGIILTDNNLNSRNKSGNPKYAVAFKSQLDEQIAITEVVDVEWNPSKRGILVPRVKLKPFKIGGDTITYTTGFNAKFIKDNKIGLGSKLKMIRSGDVIPYIMEVLSPSKNGKALFPSSDIQYRWVQGSDNKDNMVNIELINKNLNTSVLIKQLANFFTTLKISGISEGILTRMVEAGFRDLKKICTANQDDFLVIQGVKEKSAQNLYQNIHKIINEPIELHKIMAASNCFDGLAIKKLKIIIDTYPKIMSMNIKNITVEMVQKCEGYSGITSRKFIEGFKLFKTFLKENDYLKIKTVTKKKSKNIKNKNLFNNVYVVCTGFRDLKLEEIIESMGGVLQSNVNSKTNLLVAKDLNANSSKIKKANEMQITMITYDSLLKMIN